MTRAYKSSTCDVMYRRQRRHLYYGGQIYKYYLAPPPQLSLHRRAALSCNSNGTRSVYSRENPKRSLYCEMSVDTTVTLSTTFVVGETMIDIVVIVLENGIGE
jgi:hypothetical protein